MVATINNTFRDPSVYTSAAAETASLITGSVALFTGAGLLQLHAYNSSSSAAFVQVFDGYAAPENASVPLLSVPVATITEAVLEFTTSNWLPVTKGIVIVLSSTQPTYTQVANKLFCTALWTTR